MYQLQIIQYDKQTRFYFFIMSKIMTFEDIFNIIHEISFCKIYKLLIRNIISFKKSVYLKKNLFLIFFFFFECLLDRLRYLKTINNIEIFLATLPIEHLSDAREIY